MCCASTRQLDYRPLQQCPENLIVKFLDGVYSKTLVGSRLLFCKTIGVRRVFGDNPRNSLLIGRCNSAPENIIVEYPGGVYSKTVVGSCRSF